MYEVSRQIPACPGAAIGDRQEFPGFIFMLLEDYVDECPNIQVRQKNMALIMKL